ncbi:MAG: hypothetical protein KA715_01485 [Xanthomonadaceae bacterium]|nr:hypothetical protein [Xanthomonadaceae bacterium]
MKKYAIVASLLALSSPLAHAMSDYELAGFCEDKQTALQNAYRTSVSSLELASKNAKDLGAEVVELMKPNMEAALKLKGRFNEDKLTTMEKIKNYRDEVNSVKPESLQNNSRYLYEMLVKHGIERTFAQDAWSSCDLFLNALTSLEKKFRFWDSPVPQVKKALKSKLSENGADEDNSKVIDKFARKGSVLEIPVSIQDGTDYSGRTLNRESTILLKLGTDGIEVNVKNSKAVFSEPTATEKEFSDSEIRKTFPECVEYLGIK